MRTLRFHSFGEPADVLRLEDIEVPTLKPNRIRARIRACGLNPADWALCRGLFAGLMPRGVGLDVAGVVDAIGEGVTDIAVGDHVVGVPDYAGETSAGAADQAILKYWTRAPTSLAFNLGATLPMAIETAARHLDQIGVQAGQTILLHGAGSVIGFAAVQMAIMRGANVIATAGPKHADQLRSFGAKVTSYGDGMADRVRALGAVDLVLDTAPIRAGVLPELIRVAGDPRRVLTISDHTTAATLNVRHSFDDPNVKLRHDALAPFVALAAEGKFTVPIAGTFSLSDWRTAMDISLSGKAGGKLLLLP
jgi:NADPH:quinone reductase-like Zn-dependent oxidoreductase